MAKISNKENKEVLAPNRTKHYTINITEYKAQKVKKITFYAPASMVDLAFQLKTLKVNEANRLTHRSLTIYKIVCHVRGRKRSKPK